MLRAEIEGNQHAATLLKVAAGEIDYKDKQLLFRNTVT